jgi:hypothetical protein
MAITQAEFVEWLEQDGVPRCVLIEVDVKSGGVEMTRYLSNLSYTTNALEVPANEPYIDIVTGSIKFTESIGLTGNGSLSYGDIELDNTDGLYDDWLFDIWRNRSIRVYIGDIRWPRSDFRQIFNGVVDDIGSRSRNRLNLKLRDKMQRLNTPITEAKLGGTTENKDRLLPFCIGEVHNIEPLLVDPANHVYKWHDGTSERLIEARDDGVPITATANLGNSTFTLSAQPVGTITCSVQGDKNGAYTNNIADLIQRLATGFGKVSDRLTVADFDTSNFAAFKAANPQPVGFYASDKTNVLETCQRLAASVGAQLVPTRQGLLRLLRVELPPTGTPVEVYPTNMVQKTLAIVERTEVVAAVKVGYAKNWTVQEKLQTGIPQAHADMYAKEWLTVTRDDAAVASEYRLTKEPDQEDTLLLVEADANGEALRRLNLKKVPRTVFEYTGFADSLLLELGQAVTLYHPRFGLGTGKTGMIVKLEPDWSKCRVKVQVMI